MLQSYLLNARQYVTEGCWVNAQYALRQALPLAAPSQRGHILRALKACKLAIAERSHETA